jgi:predicted porin
LNLTGPSKEGEPELNGRFEADFAGNAGYNNFSGTSGSNSGFRIRQSYGAVKYKDLGLTLLFGQTDDLFSPIDPPSINPSSLNGSGNIGNRRPQIRVTQALGPVELAVAATHDRMIDDAKAPSTPGVQGRLGTKIPATWAGEKANLALGIAGHYAKNEAANADDDNRAVRPPESYSFNVDLSLPLMDILTLTGEFFTGQNLRRYGDGSLGLSPIQPDPEKGVIGDTKDSNSVQSIGWWGALALKLPANFSAATGVGMESLDKESEQYGKVKSNMFIFANVAYNFTSAAKLTFEYLNLAADYADTKDDKKVDSGSLNRFELNFRYDFK